MVPLPLSLSSLSLSRQSAGKTTVYPRHSTFVHFIGRFQSTPRDSREVDSRAVSTIERALNFPYRDDTRCDRFVFKTSARRP